MGPAQVLVEWSIAVRAVINDRGRQYTITDGEQLLVDHLPLADVGGEHVFQEVLAVDGDVGTPYVSGAKVSARVEGHVKGAKIYVEKFHRRKDYRRRQGHRQQFTRLTIQTISK